jgi:hypothetical protein
VHREAAGSCTRLLLWLLLRYSAVGVDVVADPCDTM